MRVAICDDGMRLLGFQPTDRVQGLEANFRISAKPKMVPCTGRMLEVPHLVYHQDSRNSEVEASFLQRGKWFLKERAFAVTPTDLVRYSVIEFLQQGRGKEEIDSTHKRLEKILRQR